MNPSELVARETKEWLAKALDDLGRARVLAGASHEAGALYHCRQSVEKKIQSVPNLA
jgi:HEPN domain-containing protein